MHYLLFYEVGDDYVARRAQLREAHLEKAWKASARGELVLGGALANPVDGAVLLFKGDSPEVAEKFAREDPYVTSGAVKRWHVREWNTVAGEDSANPIRPKGHLQAGEVSKPLPPLPGTVLRMWKAQSTPEKGPAYIRHASEKVFPSIGAIQGFRGACLLRNAAAGAIELVVFTLWESMEAVRRFAGLDPDKAVVDAEAKPNLTQFDEFVTHYEVVFAESSASMKAE